MFATHVCKPRAAVAEIVYPSLHAEQSTVSPFSHNVPTDPVRTVGVPFGQAQSSVHEAQEILIVGLCHVIRMLQKMLDVAIKMFVLVLTVLKQLERLVLHIVLTPVSRALVITTKRI